MRTLFAGLLWLVLVMGCQTSSNRVTLHVSGSLPATSAVPASANSGSARGSQSSALLPDTVIPRAYELELELDPNALQYRGTVAITIDITEATSMLRLHSEGPVIGSARLRLANGREMVLGSPIQQGPDGLIGFALASPVQPGTATLDIEFRGKYDDRVGIFRQSYEGTNYVFTDMEPIDARRGFPCFDEPRFKTPWSISLVIPEGLMGLSNMPASATEPAAPGKTHIRFAPTRPLPTYLVAVAVGPFELVEVPASRSPLVPIRMVVPRGKAAWGRRAAEMAPELLDIVTRYLDMPVPFPKLDFIAVPRMGGAMENPGLITVGAHILLQDPKARSIEQERLLALVLAHEAAHLWFGDLVTLADWHELWLNEGFATWLADKALYAWRPDAMPHVEQVVAKTEAMSVDERPESRAVRAVERTRAGFQGAFDALSYKKAGAVIAMLEAWVGEEVFRAAVRAYVAQHADGSVTLGSFTAALSHAAGRDMDAAVASFVNQAGVPKIDITLECRAGKAAVELAQTPYRALGQPEPPASARAGARWHIPVCVRYPAAGPAGGESRQCMVLDQPRARMELSTSTCPAWLMPNADAHGYYRYKLPVEQLTALARAPLSDRESTDFVHNLQALVASGELLAGDALAAFASLGATRSRHAIEAMAAMLATLGDHLVGPAEQARFQAYVRTLFGARARALGFAPRPGESDEDVLLRPVLLELVGRYGGDVSLGRTAQKLARDWLSTGRGITPGLIAATLRLAAHSGNAELFGLLETKLRAAKEEDQQSILAPALAAFTDPALIERAVALLGQPEMPGRHILVRELLSTPAARADVMDFLANQRSALLGSAGGPMVLVFPLWASGYCSEAEIDDLAAVVLIPPSGHELRGVIDERISELRAEARTCSALRSTHAGSTRVFLQR